MWVGAWSALQSLDLSKNRITGLLATGLTMLDALETLYIQENLLDRTMSFDAKLPLEIQGWYTGIDQNDISNQEDLTAPVMTTETIILSPVM